MKLHGPVVVQVDNLQAKTFQEGTCVQSRLRGTFDLREAWVQELRQRHEIKVEHVSTVNNYADLLTKVHKTSRYKQLLAMIGFKEEKRHRVSLAVGRMTRISSG